ncbi:crotonase/enoyl-CoA hydratase family protein [Altererythrobacter sp. ZODW24]|uniref:crotonase/enoyl-CoA hydratase family protein n=1 Tax=Altererythrobacter sp. ZODW24 TaxID=2185142 RepID=UPI000DF7AD35|nr:crotonase/enoyl-CoA hydratase family protein [Altererythrobacter sp. ZODW24]
MSIDYRENERVSITLGENGVAQVRLIRADKMNALDPDMFQAIIDAGHALHRAKGLRAVVLSGEGKSFCAGLDLASMAQVGNSEGKAPLTERTYGNANMFQQVAMVWRKLPVPVIAAIHGVCFGGGLQIASGADFRIAAPDTRLAIMEMRWGIIPDMGGFALWSSTVRDDVLRMLTYTNTEFNGEQAVEYGLATEVSDDPLARATALAEQIASKNPDAIREAKGLFGTYLHLSEDDVLMEESVRQQRLTGTKNQMEAVTSQMQKRPANFEDH